MPWRWDPQAQRYRNVNGSAYFISRDQVMGWVNTSLSQTGLVADNLTDMISSDLLSPSDWNIAGREEIKREYIRQYLLARGGVNMMTFEDWGSIGGMLKEQYGWWRGFYAEVEAGNLTDGQIRSRMRMYINSAREAYERAHSRVAGMWGADEEAWFLNPALENCPDCIDFQDLGWQPIGYFPFPGQGETVCLTNCGCQKFYRNSTTGEEFESE